MAENTPLVAVQPRTSRFVPEVAPAVDAEKIIQEQRKQRINEYNIAVDASDPAEKVAQLNNIIKSDPTDDIGKTAIKAVTGAEDRASKFNAWVDPIEKAGGPGNPAGNLAVAKVWSTQKDHPQWGTALISYLMGNKAAALNYVTGGQEKDSVIWGKDGGRYIATVNELGQTSKVKDASGNELSPQDVEDLGISYDSYEKTQAAENEKLTKKARTERLNSDVERNNEYFTFWSTADKQAQNVINSIKDATANLSPEEIRQVYGITTKAITNASSGSTSDQNIKTEGGSTSVKTGKSAKAGVAGKVGNEGTNFGGSLGGEADTGITTGTSNTTQIITGKTSGAQNETNVATNKEALAKQLALTKLSGPQQNALLNAYDTYVGIIQGQAQLAEKYGKPGFIANLQPTKLGDQQSQLEAQLLLVRNNAAQMASYKDFFNKSVDAYRQTKTVPDFGQLDAEFVKTNKHKEISREFGKSISNAFRSDPTRIPTEERFVGSIGEGIAPAAPAAAPAPAAAVAPPPPASTAPAAPARAAVPRTSLPKGIPAGSRDTGKFSTSGKKVYRAPDGSLHTED